VSTVESFVFAFYSLIVDPSNGNLTNFLRHL
jgi:hypothetical protein